MRIRGNAGWLPNGALALASPLSTQRDGQNATFTVKPGDWQEITVQVPAEGAIGILRLYLPAQKQPIELDWIELAGKAKPKRWEF